MLPETDKKTAIVSMDIDGFKYFNDMFGYGEGNDLLRYIWQEVKASLNEGEILAHGVADTFIFCCDLIREKNCFGVSTIYVCI